MIILAADPGLDGGLAEYDSERRTLDVGAMPTYKKDIRGGKSRRFMDEENTWARMQRARVLGAELFIGERVGGLPGQSAAGAFTFGYGCGALFAFARALGFRIERVEPSIWKRAMRCPADKQAARARASELFPRHSHLWPLKGDDGKAEAALLALYAAEHLI